MLLTLVNEHGQHVSLLHDYWQTLTDPAHLLTEVTITILFALLELVFIRILYRKLLKPRLTKQIHAEVDAEHGVTHVDSPGEQFITLDIGGTYKTVQVGDTITLVRQYNIPLI